MANFLLWCINLSCFHLHALSYHIVRASSSTIISHQFINSGGFPSNHQGRCGSAGGMHHRWDCETCDWPVIGLVKLARIVTMNYVSYSGHYYALCIMHYASCIMRASMPARTTTTAQPPQPPPQTPCPIVSVSVSPISHRAFDRFPSHPVPLHHTFNTHPSSMACP